MRFTRAAKVAAFPLLAMVLVVALIACQAGPPGKDGTVGTTGTTGPTGMAAPPGLDAAKLDTVYFVDLPIGEMAEIMMVDVSAGFTGGTAAGRTYAIATTVNVPISLTMDLDESTGMLTLTVAATTAALTQSAEDAMIYIEGTDTDGARETATVRVRLNHTPTVAEVNQMIAVTVGTQPAVSGEGDEPDYDNRENVTCAMLNMCSVTLAVENEFNARDTVTWRFHVDSDKVFVDDTDDGVMITGKKSTATGNNNDDEPVAVYVWAEDEAGYPKLVEDNPETTDVDETTKWPEGAARLINVTVDGAPSLGSGDPVGDQSMEVSDTLAVGTVFDSEDETITLVQSAGDPQVVMASLDTTTTSSRTGRTINVDSQNRVSAGEMITIKLMEPATTVGNPGNPGQYVEFSFTVTVSN